MDICKMFDNAFYNDGVEELTMDEQDEYIDFLKDVTGFERESYTPYVPFVVELLPGYVSNYIMVRFFTVLSLLHHFQKSFDLRLIILHYKVFYSYVFNRESLKNVCLDGCLLEAILQLFLHSHGKNSSRQTTPLKVKVKVMVVA